MGEWKKLDGGVEKMTVGEGEYSATVGFGIRKFSGEPCTWCDVNWHDVFNNPTRVTLKCYDGHENLPNAKAFGEAMLTILDAEQPAALVTKVREALALVGVVENEIVRRADAGTNADDLYQLQLEAARISVEGRTDGTAD